MLTSKLTWTALLTLSYALVAMAADFLLNVVIARTPQQFNPAETASLSVFIGAPVTYYLIGQRIDLRRAVAERDQSASDLAVAIERAEAAGRAKSDFLANMTHELRTPLNAIVGFAGVLGGSRDLTATDRRHVGLIADASDTLLGVVNSVLDFSRQESGAIQLDSQPFDPEALAAAVTEMVAGQARAQGLTLSVSVHGDNVELMGDGPRLRQVLLNLVGNALKFTPAGRVEVAIEQSASAPGRRRLRLRVNDTGIGIADDQLASIFERFSQADVSVTRRFGGTGLGLAICKRLVELMGGEIQVSSRLGRGSSFWFELDLPVAASPALAPPAEPAPHDAIVRPVRMLLVEDVPVNQELMRAILAPFPIEIECADNGAEAIEAVARADYDLVLMDVQMPVMDGLTATRAIRARGGRLGRLPIIAMTANVLPEQIRLCREAGMDGHLGKPIETRALLETIAAWSAGEASRDAPLAETS